MGSSFLGNMSARMKVDLFNGKSYQKQSCSAQAIQGASHLGHVDGTMAKPPIGDPAYSEWSSENILVTNWIFDPMERIIRTCLCILV